MDERSRFYKMTGSGNDFVFLDGRAHDLEEWPVSRIAGACDRRRGVGADGVVHLDRLGDGAIRMIYFNADGSRADLCGNAALCSTRLAARWGLADPSGMAIETDAGRLESRCVGPTWGAELKFPSVLVPQPLDFPLEDGERRAFQGTVGVPHTVILVDEIQSVDVVRRGRVLRFSPTFEPAGSNINFIGPTNGSSDASWALRTYERGVEDETLACGTGTIAAALAFASAGLSQLPVRIRSASGCVYSVSATLEGDRLAAKDVWLCGEGRLVFTGELADISTPFNKDT